MNEATPSTTRSTAIYAGRVFNVTLDDVAYPDGRSVRMEVVRHRGSVVLLPMTAAGGIVLVRQYRYVVNQWLWELPAGTLEAGELPEAAALRECHEEVGQVAARAERLLSLYPSPGFCDEEMHFFRLTGLRDRLPGEPAAHQDPDERLNVKEFTVDDVRQMVRTGGIRDMKTAVGITLL